MRNLGTFLTEDNVLRAIELVIREKKELIAAKKFALVYKGRQFPPKEIARIAARLAGVPETDIPKYRLNGGPPINDHFERLGFEIVNFKDTKQVAANQTDPRKRIVRLCWNDKGWVRPSGWEGKSKSKSHEKEYGYGHEEWLFDTGRLIDGYHYGFLEPIRKEIDAFKNKTFDVKLFTINGDTDDRYWAGMINDLEVIDPHTAERIRQEYIRRGWLQVMEDEVKKIQELKKIKQGWSNYKGLDFFNVRFRPENIHTEYPYRLMSPDNPLVKASRYSFIIEKEEYLSGFYTIDTPFFFRGTNKPLDNRHAGAPLTRTFTRELISVEITELHQKISYGLTRKLREKYGDWNVDPEYPAGFLGREIDIVVRDNDEIIFYEIKTYNALIQSIRIAVGQLMEYALWTNHARAEKWIIVTQPHADLSAASTYFSHIRDNYGLPLYYQTYDWETDRLSRLK
jgi:hypothetical protein